MLIAIKLLHTAIWAFLAGNIVASPVVGVLRRFRWAAIITAVILLECGVLAANGGRCPLTGLAAKYTADRRPNFDIFLPNWLAENNKVIFGTLFVVGEGVVVACWLRGKFPTALRMRNCASHEVKETGDDHEVFKAGVLYFALVFAAGFVLGTVRTLWVVPRAGVRMAELMEAPIMLVVTVLATRWTIFRLAVPDAWSVRLAMGSIALLLMLVAEFGFVLWVRGLSFRDYLSSRDPVSGAVYYILLGVFALMPLLMVRG